MTSELQVQYSSPISFFQFKFFNFFFYKLRYFENVLRKHHSTPPPYVSKNKQIANPLPLLGAYEIFERPHTAGHTENNVEVGVTF